MVSLKSKSSVLVCDDCGKKSTGHYAQIIAKNHAATHFPLSSAQLRKYSCDECDVRAFCITQIKRHWLLAHCIARPQPIRRGEIDYVKCDACPKKVRRGDATFKHWLRHHARPSARRMLLAVPTYRFRCDHCLRSLNALATLAHHVFRYHML
mgnify:CR=1 FL=1